MVLLVLVATAALASVAAGHPPKVVSAYAHGHPYRRGVVPPRDQQKKAAGQATSTGNLTYGDGISGVGVTTGPPKVYLVFWGCQWGTGRRTPRAT